MAVLPEWAVSQNKEASDQAAPAELPELPEDAAVGAGPAPAPLEAAAVDPLDCAEPDEPPDVDGAPSAAPDEAEGASFALLAGTPDPEAAPEDSASLPAVLPLSRKSVTYQPLPLSWKAGAVNCLAKLSWLHCGHVTSGGSDRFCNASFSNPQLPHR
jgi:hypothetical protein